LVAFLAAQTLVDISLLLLFLGSLTSNSLLRLLSVLALRVFILLASTPAVLQTKHVFKNPGSVPRILSVLADLCQTVQSSLDTLFDVTALGLLLLLFLFLNEVSRGHLVLFDGCGLGDG